MKIYVKTVLCSLIIIAASFGCSKNKNAAGVDTGMSDMNPSYRLGSPPPLKGPAKKGWNHKRTAVIATGTPYHMVRDEIAVTGTKVTLQGKFEYNRVAQKDIEDEIIHAYLLKDGDSTWEYLGKELTDSDGKVTFGIGPKTSGTYAVTMIAQGDLSKASGYLNVVDPGAKTVIFDIDGTLTKQDNEIFEDYLGLDDADPYPGAAEVVKYYQEKGCQIVMITGRPYWLSKHTKSWQAKLNIPGNFIRFTPKNTDAVPGQATQKYKTDAFIDLRDRAKLNFVRAYGNAQTDIKAYKDNKIPADQIFIIGENAGKQDTRAITCTGDKNCGYKDHLKKLKEEKFTCQ